jgi:hypothetical protein
MPQEEAGKSRPTPEMPARHRERAGILEAWGEQADESGELGPTAGPPAIPR